MKLKEVLREEWAKQVGLNPLPSLSGEEHRDSFDDGWEHCDALYQEKIQDLCINLEMNTIGLSPDQVERITRYIKLSLNNLGDEEVPCQEDQQP